MEMPLDLAHKQTKVYATSLELLDECYRLALLLPLSIVMNIAEGSARLTPTEKKRFYEISRSSVVEIDTAFVIALRMRYLTEVQLELLNNRVESCFKMLSKMISYQLKQAKT